MIEEKKLKCEDLAHTEQKMFMKSQRNPINIIVKS